MAAKKKTAKKAAKSKSKAVATTNKGGVPKALQRQLKKDTGKGQERITKDDLTIPRLNLAQKLSPQVEERSDAYIEGLEAGDIFNTLTNENYGEELIVIPVFYYRSYIEFVPRDSDGSGGGFVKEHESFDMSETEKDDDGRMMLDNGNQIVETANNFFLIVHKDGTLEPIVSGMTSTKWMAARKLNSLTKQLRVGDDEAPRFAGKYVLRSVFRDRQPAYYTYDIEFEGWVEDEDMYLAARNFYDSVSSGKVKAAKYEDDNVHGDDDDSDDDEPF